MGFIQDSKMVLNLAQFTWEFLDDANVTYELYEEDYATFESSAVNIDSVPQKKKRKDYVDRHRRKLPEYQPGDMVLVNLHPISKGSQGISAKFAPRRDGPYIIKEQHGPASFKLASVADPGTSIGLYHASALTPYKRGDEMTAPNPFNLFVVEDDQESKLLKRKQFLQQPNEAVDGLRSKSDMVLVNLHPISKGSQGISAKFAPRRDGPYIIKEQHGPASFKLASVADPGTSIGLYHASALTPYKRGDEMTAPNPFNLFVVEDDQESKLLKRKQFLQQPNEAVDGLRSK
ncbi:hypothetical protein HF086_017656, partial [Spodoptera exigua]